VEVIRRIDAKRSGQKRYYTGKPCKSGHTAERLVANGRCALCLKDWKKANREKVNAAQQRHRDANPDRWRQWDRNRYHKDVELSRLKARVWARTKALSKPKRQVKYPNPIMKELANRMRCRMWDVLRKGKSGKSLESVLGYGIDELRRHIERQFLRGMSWSNRSEWHIDHIIPIASFNFTSHDDAEFKACWALTNLRPLWKIDNMSKGPRRQHLL